MLTVRNILIPAFALMLLAPAMVRADCPEPTGICTIFVRANANPGGASGNSFADDCALKYLQDALTIAMSQQNPVICVAEGSYQPDCTATTCTGDPDATFELLDGVRIYGGFTGLSTEHDPEDREDQELPRPGDYGPPTVLSGEMIRPFGTTYSRHVVTVTSGARIDRVTISDGIAVPDAGGGILHAGGRLDLVESILDSNVADFGGGLWIDADAEAWLDRCLIQSNIAKHCAGVLVSDNANFHSENTEYYGNTSDGPGGGACVLKGALGNFHGDLFRDNTAGVNDVLDDDEMVMYRAGGGAVFISEPLFVDLYNCTIVDNVALATECHRGGGGVMVDAQFVDYHVRIRNSIVWGNTDLSCPLSDCECDPDAHDFEDQVKLPGTTALIEHSDVQQLSETPIGPGITDNDSDGFDDSNGNTDTDPIFSGPGRIATESPLVNRGDSDYADWANDIDRNSRIVDEDVDMGVNEVQVGACCLMGQCSFGPAGECGFVCDMYDYFAAPPYTGCYGDVNGDSFVTPADRGFVAANIGQTSPDQMCQFDLDGNGVINPADRGVVTANIGLCTALPDFQNGSGSNHGEAPDPRFIDAAEFFAGESCEDVSCEEGGGETMMGGESMSAVGEGQDESSAPAIDLYVASAGWYSIMVDAGETCLDGAAVFGVSDEDETVIDDTSVGTLTSLGELTSATVPSTLFGAGFARRDMVLLDSLSSSEAPGDELCQVLPASGVTLRLEVYVWRVNEDESIDAWSAALTAE